MSLRMTATLTDRGALNLDRRIDTFMNQVRGAEKAAAAMATRTSRTTFRRTRPIAPARPGRRGTGQMANSVRWRALKGGFIGFNLAEMDQKNPHWIIQEIGTGEKAVMRVAGASRPTGRPAAGNTYVRTVKSQIGRRISSGLVFASGPGGKYSPPGSARGQQLYLRRKVQGVPFSRTRSQPGIRIQREIKGQHFVKRGGETGFREYRESVLSAARQQFRKSRV